MTSLHRIALNASFVVLILAVILFAVDRPLIAGPLLTLFFAVAAFGVRGNEKLRGISFSLLIFAAVSLAMNYPAPFVSWGDFSMSALIVPLLQIIMFGMGTQISAQDFIGVAKDPRGVGIGLACQFTIMPFVGAGLALAFGLEPEIAAGIVLIGAAPSGLASNVMAYIGKAILALSVTLTIVATLVAPFITPFYMQWLAGELIPIDPWGMMRDIIRITILPIVAGLATGLATEMGKAATLGLVPTVFGSPMNITGATLASFWADKPPGSAARRQERRAASSPA